MDYASLESPLWHEAALRETEDRIQSGDERILDWREAKEELRKRQMKLGERILLSATWQWRLKKAVRREADPPGMLTGQPATRRALESGGKVSLKRPLPTRSNTVCFLA